MAQVLIDVNKMQVDSLKKGNEEGQLQELWSNWTLGQRFLETRWRGTQQL